MKPFSCRQCTKLLFKGTLGPGTEIEIKCTRCKAINTIGDEEHAGGFETRPDGQGGFVLARNN